MNHQMMIRTIQIALKSISNREAASSYLIPDRAFIMLCYVCINKYGHVIMLGTESLYSGTLLPRPLILVHFELVPLLPLQRDVDFS